MTKAALRSLLKNTLAQVDKVSKYHDTYLDHVLETCLNSVYFQVHEQNPRALGQYTKAYSVATALYSATTGRYGIFIPTVVVPMPDKRGGVRAIRSTLGLDTYFAPITNMELALMEDSQADSLTVTTPTVVYYTVFSDIIDFKNMTATIAAAPFFLDLLVAFTSLADTDQVPLPYGKNVEIMKMALEMIGVIPPKDLLDNNAER